MQRRRDVRPQPPPVLPRFYTRYRVQSRQDAWVRQLEPEIGQVEEDGMLRTVARLDGVSFPSLTKLGARWLRGRDATLCRKRSALPGRVNRTAGVL